MPPCKPGDAVSARCPRCDDVTGHVVVALVGNEIVKVECRACGGVHRYRPPQPASRRKDAGRAGSAKQTDAVREARAAGASSFLAASSPSAGRTTGGRAAKAAQALEEEWLRAVTPAAGASARPYAIRERFAVGEVVDHPVFGSGVVREVLPPDKMRVLFRDGPRLLRCAC